MRCPPSPIAASLLLAGAMFASACGSRGQETRFERSIGIAAAHASLNPAQIIIETRPVGAHQAYPDYVLLRAVIHNTSFERVRILSLEGRVLVAALTPNAVSPTCLEGRLRVDGSEQRPFAIAPGEAFAARVDRDVDAGGTAHIEFVAFANPAPGVVLVFEVERAICSFGALEIASRATIEMDAQGFDSPGIVLLENPIDPIQRSEDSPILLDVDVLNFGVRPLAIRDISVAAVAVQSPRAPITGVLEAYLDGVLIDIAAFTAADITAGHFAAPITLFSHGNSVMPGSQMTRRLVIRARFAPPVRGEVLRLDRVTFTAEDGIMINPIIGQTVELRY